MFQLELVSFLDLGLQLRRLWFPCIESLPNYLMQKVVAEDFHHRSIHWGLWQREHLLETLIHESDLHIVVRDQNALDHTRQDRPQTEVFVGDLSLDLSLPPRHLFQVLVNFPHDPGTWNLMGKHFRRNQTPHFAAQNK